jgi:hypothetical protein
MDRNAAFCCFIFQGWDTIKQAVCI